MERPIDLNGSDLLQNNLEYIEKLEFEQPIQEPIQEPNNYGLGLGYNEAL